MGKKDKQRARLVFEDVGEEGRGGGGEERDSKSVDLISNSDDEEANEDLSLKIVEKALLMRATKFVRDEDVGRGVFSGEGRNISSGEIGGVVSLSSSSQEAEATAGTSGVSGGGIIVAPGQRDLRKQKIIRKEKKKGMKVNKLETGECTVVAAKEEEKTETVEVTDADGSVDVEGKIVEITDNIVFRKLLRGPRYFDPPGTSWGTCYNCGEEGHTALNCMSTKPKKPCFVCGSLEHYAKSCSKAQDCYICKKSGHRAKDCPEKHKSGSSHLKICLKCGASGHDMFSCKSHYSLDDLKKIQCYICKAFGHLCCAKTANNPSEVSCYKCGHLGHTGLACARLRGEDIGMGPPSSCYNCGEEGHFARECSSSTKACARLREEATGMGTPRSCYNCGEEGHFARECSSFAKASAWSHEESTGMGTPSSCYRCGGGGHFARECLSSNKASAWSHEESTDMGTPSSCYKCGGRGHFARECLSSNKVSKRNRKLSTTPTLRFHRDERDFFGSKSVPYDVGNNSRKKKTRYEGRDATTPQKSKHRGGWITEDPGDFKSKNNYWGSPGTPPSKVRKVSSLHSGGYTSPRSTGNSHKVHKGSSVSQGSSRASQHRFSSSRFGDFSSDGARRNYMW